jgi:hypothetical protein
VADDAPPAGGTEDSDPGRDFAALMSQAAAAADPGAAEAPYGWTTGRDGVRRPKKSAGRPRKPPSLDELKTAATAATTKDSPEGASDDRAPSEGKHRKSAAPTGKPGAAEIPQHRPGVITRGMNKRYRQLGKMMRPIDQATGQALVEMAKNTAGPPAEGEEPADDSVGAAWDEVARGNPRIRRFCLAMIQGGAWGALAMAHTPLLLAVAMKFVSANPGFVGKMIKSMAEPDEDTPEGDGGLPGGLTAGDMSQMMSMAQQMAERIMNDTGRPAAPGAASNRTAA